MTDRDLVSLLADLTQSACAAHLGGRLDTCILNTRVFIEAAKYHGLAAAPVSVRVIVGNAAAWEAIRDGIVIADWPPEAHTVGFDDRHPDSLQARAGRWPGHLVASVKPPQGPRLLVDSSFAQFARPERGIEVPPWLAAEFPSPWDDDTPLVGGLPDGGAVVYGPTYGPLASGWRDSPDWTGSVKDLTGFVVRSSNIALDR